MSPQTDFDVVIIGGGHNGLVCAGYLARAGMRVCVVEARSQVGGCAGSEQVLGATVNICNCDHSLIRTLPIIDDLNLERHGLRYLELDPGQVGLGWDAGAPIPLFRSVERTLDGLAVNFPGQVDNYRRYVDDAIDLACFVLESASEPPSGRSILARAAAAPRTTRRLLQWSSRSVGDVLRHYFDDEAILGPAMATGPAVWGLSSDTPGTGLGAVALALKHVAPVGRPVGGSGALTDALAASFETSGGHLLTGARVTRIHCDGRAVRGVTVEDVTVDGEPVDQLPGGDPAGGDPRTIEAPVVVVAANPSAAVVQYLENPPSQADGFVERWAAKPRVDGYESKLDVRLSGLPRWRHTAGNGLGAAVGWDDQLSASTLVSPSLSEIDRAHLLLAEGRVTDRPMLFVNFPSVLDPSLAPPGQHVMSIEVIYTPYRLRGGWDGSSEPARWLELAAGLFEPGLLDLVEDWRAVTPPDYEQRFSMPAGHADSFAGGPAAVLVDRTDRELVRYRTPVPGLYLTGAATFPGAGVWGAPGRNTALTILRRV